MDQTEKKKYSRILRENTNIIFKKWPWNYHCGYWDKHEPDKAGRRYSIFLNQTKGKECQKITLIHEVIHIDDDLEGKIQTNGEVEDKALKFYEKNKKFVYYLWRRYVEK